MGVLSMILLASAPAVSGEVFHEDGALWERIDRLNEALEAGEPSSDELKAHFETALKTAFSFEFGRQIDDLRSFAFTSGRFDLADLYTERAAPAITVIMGGEADHIGVNVRGFMLLCEPGTEAYEFFGIAMDGFYVDGENRLPGTAYLPVWMEPGESGGTGVFLPEKAYQWKAIWEMLSPGFEGVFLDVARETIAGLEEDRLPEDPGLEGQCSAYRNPFALHLRSAFNTFLAGGTHGILPDEDLMNRLQTHRDYLADPFMVVALNPSPMGGQIIRLVSRAKPDRVFQAWVYELGSGALELRDFHQDLTYSADDAGELFERYRENLDDGKHRI